MVRCLLTSLIKPDIDRRWTSLLFSKHAIVFAILDIQAKNTYFADFIDQFINVFESNYSRIARVRQVDDDSFTIVYLNKKTSNVIFEE